MDKTNWIRINLTRNKLPFVVVEKRPFKRFQVVVPTFGWMAGRLASTPKNVWRIPRYRLGRPRDATSGVSERSYLQAGTVILQSYIGNNRGVFDNLRVHSDHDVSPALAILNPYLSNRTKPFAAERCQVLFLNMCQKQSCNSEKQSATNHRTKQEQSQSQRDWAIEKHICLYLWDFSKATCNRRANSTPNICALFWYRWLVPYLLPFFFLWCWCRLDLPLYVSEATRLTARFQCFAMKRREKQYIQNEMKWYELI